jgi:hypothetical protein
MKFDFKITSSYGKRGPIFYHTNEIQVVSPTSMEYNKIFVYGSYETRVNGANTAIAYFNCSIRWLTAQDGWFGWYLTKHFSGNNCGIQARRWLNWLLNNTPNYCTQGNTRRPDGMIYKCTAVYKHGYPEDCIGQEKGTCEECKYWEQVPREDEPDFGF